MSKIKKLINYYLLHQYPDSVRQEFADWFVSEQDFEQKDTLLCQEWEDIDVQPNKLQSRRSYEAVMSRIHNKENKAHRMALVSQMLRVAVVVVVALAVTAIVGMAVNRSPRLEWKEVYTQRGESRTVELEDGSTIRLAPGSRLIYPTAFTEDVRRVYLSGEAFADIAKDETRRFVVAAEQVDVVVHGTQFNIRAYDSNSEVEVMLLEGSVDMQTKNMRQNRTMRMRPGDFVKLDKRSGRLTCENIPKDMFEQNSRSCNLTFINSRLGDIAVQLERMFDVRIIIDQASLAEERYYSAFVNNESLDRILSTLEQNGKMSYRWNQGEIHLYIK
ncbi:MAG: FecR domain-containing protein [Alistipes sp.]|nr:FecR domain-containing protein [Alistipes sp.]